MVVVEGQGTRKVGWRAAKTKVAGEGMMALFVSRRLDEEERDVWGDRGRLAEGDVEN